MSANPRQLALDVALRDFPTLDNVITGPNSEAIDALTGLLSTPGQLLLWGRAATGKSLLLQAVARQATERGLTAAYFPLTQLPLDNADYLAGVLSGLENLDLVCLDDLQAVAGSRAAEMLLVEFISRLRAAQASLLLSSRQSAETAGFATADLRSRLGWGTVYRLRELADEDKAKLLVDRADNRGMKLDIKVARFLLRRQSRDLNSLMSTLERLDSASLAARRSLTIPFVREVLDVESQV